LYSDVRVRFRLTRASLVAMVTRVPV
jgi:hypothetical protein